jgi:NADPH:quinone reductase-like Zn-dependent oxidoreductase
MRKALGRGAPPASTGSVSMAAIVQAAYGAAPEHVLRLDHIPRPVARDGQVVVRVAAASVDRGTWHLLTGRPQLMRLMGFGLRRPKAINPGRSFAGTVAAVGGGVAELQVGDEVYGTGDGSFAEYIAADVAKVARKPANLSFAEAACAPVSAVAALQAVRDQANLEAGQSVLVVGASGGVGTFALQLAKLFGAAVTAVASSGKLDLVRALGADDVIDYAEEDFTRGPRTWDVILDTGGNRRLADVRRALAPTGTLVIVGGESDGAWIGGFARNLRALVIAPFLRGQRLRSLASKENANDLDELRGLFEDGHLVVPVGGSYALAETAAAIRHLTDGRASGKVVVAM